MSAEMLDTLQLATAATRFGGGSVRLATRVRREGIGQFDAVRAELTGEQREHVEEEAQRLLDLGVQAVLLGSESYPQSLNRSRKAPPVLFTIGPQHLLSRHGIGICGSRKATPEAIRATEGCSDAIVSGQLTVVSGYARGVDMAAHTAALREGGSTVIVLAEGIERFSVRAGEFESVWDPRRAVVVSQFSPAQPWSAGSAMARNAVISGLSRALIVVQAGETGGTLAAGFHAIERQQPVIVLELADDPAGNRLLKDRGATAVRDRSSLERTLKAIPTNQMTQLSLI